MTTEIDKLKCLSERATPGEWTAYSEPDVGMPTTLFSGRIFEGTFTPLEPLSPIDVEFIAAAVNYVRQQLAERA